MGEKVKRVAGAALGIAAIWATGGGASPWVAGLLQGGAIVMGGLAARDARKRAEAAHRNSLKDRQTMYRSGVSAKGHAYGRSWISGALAYWRSPQTKEDAYIWMVIALPIAHRIKSIDQIWFGDQQVTPLTGVTQGESTSPVFSKLKTETSTHRDVIPQGNIVTVPLPSGAQLVAQSASGITCATRPPDPDIVAGDDASYREWTRDVPATRYSDNQIHVPGTPGHIVQLTYRHQRQISYISAWTYRGTDDQVANADLIAATAGLPADLRWTVNHRLRGVPYIILRLWPNEDVFPRELENVTVALSGKDDVLDTRTGVAGYTENSMLIARDYAIAKCGVVPTDIDVAAFNAEVNACDENILQPDPITGEPTQTRRYSTHCFLSSEEAPKDNLGVILASCDGSVVESGPTVDFRCGRYEEPDPTFVLGPSDFASHPEVIKTPELGEKYNGIKARYLDISKPFWPLVDGKAYVSAFYKAKDKNIERIEEIDLLSTLTGVAAYRIGKQILHRHRAGLIFSAEFTMKAERLSAQKTVLISHPGLGMDEKPYRVLAMEHGLTSVRLTCQEDGPLLYEHTFDESAGIDPAPNSNLPNPRIVPLIEGLGASTNLQVPITGPEQQLKAHCRVFWTPVESMTAPGRVYVLNGGRIEVRHKRSVDASWTYSPPLPPTTREYTFPIDRDDVLIIEARLVNSLNIGGEWTQIRRTASDAPAPYIVSANELRNARLEWSGTYAIGEETAYTIPGWSAYGPIDGSPGQAFAIYPHLYTFNPGSPAQTGVVIINHPDAGAFLTNGQAEWLQSDQVTVIPGKRMVLFCQAVWPVGRVFVLQIRYMTASGTVLKDEYGTPHTIEEVTGSYASLETWPIFAHFSRVPEGAYLAHAIFASYHIADTARSFWELRRPFFGEAAEGQISLPPWRA